MQLSSNFTTNYPINYPMNYSGKLTMKIIIKDDYVRADGTSALYLQIFLNKQRKRIALNITVRVCDFDKEKQRIKAKAVFSKDYNLIIEKALADINKIEINYRLSSVPITLEKLINEYENPASRMDFINFWNLEMESQKLQLKASTYRQQMSVLAKLKAYKPTLYFYEIDENFIIKLTYYLKNTLKNKDNTVASFLKSFKKYLHIANNRGIITPLSYSQIKRRNFESDRVFLMPDDLRKLNRYFHSEFINASHKAILARFLFSCFTGLRSSDVQNISPDNFSNDLLFFTSEKTGKIQKMKLNNAALSYVDEEVVFYGNFTPEHINRELKFIAKACDVTNKISFHVARHTFATNFLLSGGDVVQLQKLLGHSKITETMIYVHIVESITNIQIMSMDDILVEHTK